MNALEYFKNFNGGFHDYWIDVLFGLFLFVFLIIGMLLGAFRGTWFFLTSLTFLSIGWATSHIVGKALYNSVFQNDFANTYKLVIELSRNGINVELAIADFLGFLYILVLVSGGFIVFTLPLYFFFGKGIAYHSKKMNKTKRGLSIFIGGMSGLLFAFFSGFAIFHTTAGYESLMFKHRSIKFKNFYCLITKCNSDPYKNKIDEVYRLTNLLDKPFGDSKSITYAQVMQNIFFNSNASVPALDRINVDKLNGFSTLENLDGMLHQILFLAKNSTSSTEFIELLNKYSGYIPLFGSEYANSSTMEDKKAKLVDWLDKVIPKDINNSSFYKLSNKLTDLFSNDPNNQVVYTKMNAYIAAIDFLDALNLKLDGVSNSNNVVHDKANQGYITDLLRTIKSGLWNT